MSLRTPACPVPELSKTGRTQFAHIPFASSLRKVRERQGVPIERERGREWALVLFLNSAEQAEHNRGCQDKKINLAPTSGVGIRHVRSFARLLDNLNLHMYLFE